MTFGEKLSKLRKESNYTQEQLADILEVSRQSVSKWESDIAYPETEKLIRIAKLFDCSVDYLLKHDCTDKNGLKTEKEPSAWEKFGQAVKAQIRERKSEKTVFGMPLYHIAKNARGFFAVGLNARGVFAVGVKSKGVVSLGLLSLGVLSIGLLSLGLLAFGIFSLGLLSVGSVALGMLSAGAISIGVVSFGALSIGQFSVGALAIGKYIAVGDHARAMIAVGFSGATGSVYQYVGSLQTADMGQVIELLEETAPKYLGWAKGIMKFFLQ